MNQSELARKANVSQPTMNQWVRRTRRPSYRRSKQLAKLTNSSWVVWMDGTEAEIRKILREAK